MWKRVYHFTKNPSISLLNSIHPNNLPYIPSFHGVLSKVFVRDQVYCPILPFSVINRRGFYSTQFLKGVDKGADNLNEAKTNVPQYSTIKPNREELKAIRADKTNQAKTKSTRDSSIKPNGKKNRNSSKKPYRKKLERKKAVAWCMKKFREEKEKAFVRMTAEEKILLKLSKARKNEAQFLEALKNLEPKEQKVIHDPEVLTQEEHYYFLKMGENCKNYVPVGRRGVYGGLILNMHLHWKKHETLQVVVKTFTPEEVKEIAVELAKLSGGIVLGFVEEETIVMYRGKNYSQPSMEIMSPRISLPRLKALQKSDYRQKLREVRIFIRRLEQKLDILRARQSYREDHTTEQAEDASKVDTQEFSHSSVSSSELTPSAKLIALLDEYRNNVEEDGSMANVSVDPESEDLSDMFETDSDNERNTYNMNDPKSVELSSDSSSLAELEEVDQIFVRAAELLKKKKQ